MQQSGAVTLVERLAAADQRDLPLLQLSLDAQQRTSLRGHRRSACGRDLLLQLPRGAALQPGERLLSADGAVQVQVQAAPEPVMEVRSSRPLALLQAAYHLGNRHVALEVRPTELRLSDDPVLAHLLEHRGLGVERCREPFLPEGGAYADHHHHDHHHGAAPHPGADR